MTTTHLPIGRTVYCIHCDQPVTDPNGWLLVTLPDHDALGFWAHTDCAADEEFRANEAKPRYVVVVWHQTRENGGPEEGGWSFASGTEVLSLEFRSEAAAEAVAEGLRLEYPRAEYARYTDHVVDVLDRQHWVDVDQFDERLDLIPYFPLVRPHFE